MNAGSWLIIGIAVMAAALVVVCWRLFCRNGDPAEKFDQDTVPFPLEIEDIHGITVIRFVESQILDERKIQLISEQLFEAGRNLKGAKVVLDFSSVLFMSSSVLARIVQFAKLLYSQQNELVLCGVAPEILEVFNITRMSKLYHFVDRVEDAPTVFKEVVGKTVCPIRDCVSDMLLRYSVASASSPHERVQECPGCGSTLHYRGRLPLDSHEETLRIRRITLPTYDDESILVELDVGFDVPSPDREWGRRIRLPLITVKGRLDLFAFDVLAGSGAVSRSPRVLIDLSQATDVTDLGLKSLFELLSRGESHRKAVVLVDESTLEYVKSLAGRTSVYTDRGAAAMELADGPQAEPLTVVVRNATMG